jgi:hypothetical protein
MILNPAGSATRALPCWRSASLAQRINEGPSLTSASFIDRSADGPKTK